MVEAFLRTWDGRGMILHRSDERDLLLDTGGGLLHARRFLDTPGPVFVVNVDVLSDLDPRTLIAAHTAQAASSPVLATLAVTDRPTSRRLTFDAAMRLTGWENTETGAQKGHPQPGDQSLAFAGMQVISPELFPLIQRRGAFSIIDLYLDLVAPSTASFPNENAVPTVAPIRGWIPEMTRWMDVGKPAELERAAGFLPELLG
jgi:N-acetyl-alpha-D-muramate 1-phosphate uridylyltransferase